MDRDRHRPGKQAAANCWVCVLTGSENPYAKRLKKQVTIRLDEDTIGYFKQLADDKGIPYQSLINLYLRDCAQNHKDLKWQ
jgi:uncharacterized protein (DUF4415 family)